MSDGHDPRFQLLTAADTEALEKLAEDLRSGSPADKECAVSMLSSLTMYVDHHDALLRMPGVLDALINAVTNDRLVPQVWHFVVLSCFKVSKSQ